MSRLVRAVAVAFLLVASGALNAATWYVSTTGDDSNSGSLSSPFRTINKAASVTQPGDQVHVRGGIYYGLVSISSKGTSTARIIFQSYPGELAILDGTGTESGKDLVTLYKAEYVDFAGFEVRNATRIGICAYGSNNIRITGNDVHRSWRNGIYASYSSPGYTYDISIDNNRVHDNVLENEFQTLTNGGWAAAVVVSKADRATIAANRVYNNYGEGIDAILSDQVRIEGNSVSDSFSVGIYLDNAQYTTVSGNLVYSTGDSRFYRDGYPAAGIQMANESHSTTNPLTDNIVTNNVVFNTKWGFYYGSYENGGGLKNTAVANNTFYNAVEAILAINSDTHSGSLFENNIFYKGLSANVAGGGMTYRHNNWYATDAGSASGSGDVLADPSLVNPGGSTAADYKLTSASPLIEKGVTSAHVADDYWKTQRSAGFDIGAHEYSAGGSTADTEAPSAPSNLTVTGVSSSSVSLAWTASTDNVGVAGYRIYRNNTQVATVSGTSWSDSGLSASTTYSYQVFAYDAAGNQSAGSNVVSATTQATATTDTEAPSAPANLAVTGITTTSVSLAWTASTDNVGVTAYRIYRDGSHVGTTSNTSWTNTKLRRGKTYHYYVRAVDAAGNVSDASNTVSATTAKK